MAEELDEEIIVLHDEEGNECRFGLLDVFDDVPGNEGRLFIVLVEEEVLLSDEEGVDVLILELEEDEAEDAGTGEDADADEESYVAVTDPDLIDAVFAQFKVRNPDLRFEE